MVSSSSGLAMKVDCESFEPIEGVEALAPVESDGSRPPPKSCSEWGWRLGNEDPCDRPKDVWRAMRDAGLQPGSGAWLLITCLQQRESGCTPSQKTGTQLGLYQLNDSDDYQQCRNGLRNDSLWTSRGCNAKGPQDAYCSTLCAIFHLTHRPPAGKPDQWEVGRRCRWEAGCFSGKKDQSGRDTVDGGSLAGKCGFPK
jgi:hypothetical protein